MSSSRGRTAKAVGVRAAKTVPSGGSVSAYLGAIEDPMRRRDCRALVSLMRKVTGKPPKMWGPSIVGFDQYHYKYASGREGDMCVVGFAPRKGDISIYISCGFEKPQVLLRKLGKHKTGKACLYVKQLSEISLPVLERLVKLGVAETKRLFP